MTICRILLGICEGDDNLIWVGTDGGGVNLLNPYEQRITNIPTSGFVDLAILSALKTRSGELWFGTYQGGITIYDPINGRTKSLGFSNGLLSLDIRALFEARDGTIWIGTNGSGLHYYDYNTEELKHVSQTDYMDIRYISEGEDGNLWLASFGNGLVYFDPDKLELKEYNWFTNSRMTPVVYSLYADNKHVWVGTRQSGLLRFDPSTETFAQYSEDYGLPNNTVRAIVPDQLGNIWLSTNLGLSCVNIEEGTILNFDYSYGLQNGQFNDGSGLLLSNGDLAFGGKHGMNVFSPKELISSQMAPKVVITNINSFDKSSNSRSYHINHLKTTSDSGFELEYSENTISLEFTTLIYPYSGSWSYEYILEGNDADWIFGGKFGAVTYRNLSPGEYTFKLRSTDISRSISGEEEWISFSVQPPFWITWPAYLIYILGLSIIVIGLVLYNNTKVKLREKLIYEQKLRQQEQEVIQQKIRFFTNFSHELRSPLTLIQGPVNDLLHETENESHKSLLTLIKRNSAILLKLVNRLLDFRKLETQKTVLNIAHNDLSVFLHEEVESFNYQSGEVRRKIQLEAAQDTYAWVDIEKLHIIVSNLLSNAMKYTPPDGEINVYLRGQKDGAEIEVRDPGQGIPDEEKEAIFLPFYQAENAVGKGGTGIGLALTKSLVEMHGGEIRVNSSARGSSFILSLPNDFEWLQSQDYVRIIEPEDFSLIEDESKLKSDGEMEDKQLVLVADDNEDIRKYLESGLKGKFEVLSANNGKKAMELANKSLPDIIITDIMMPELDGIEFCRRIKEAERTSHIPVLMITAKDADESKVEAYGVGADGYITKPFSSKLLNTRIENLLNQRIALRERFSGGNWEEGPVNQESPDVRFIKMVESTIINMLDKEDVTVPGLARELGYSRTSLYRKVKSLTDLSINQFIRLIKLKRSANLLEHEDVTVSEVAFKMGFADLKYFRNCFKEHFGILPSEYQKKNSTVNRDLGGVLSSLNN